MVTVNQSGILLHMLTALIKFKTIKLEVITDNVITFQQLQRIRTFHYIISHIGIMWCEEHLLITSIISSNWLPMTTDYHSVNSNWVTNYSTISWTIQPQLLTSKVSAENIGLLVPSWRPSSLILILGILFRLRLPGPLLGGVASGDTSLL